MKNLLLFTLLVSNIILGQSFVPNAPELNLKDTYSLIQLQIPLLHNQIQMD